MRSFRNSRIIRVLLTATAMAVIGILYYTPQFLHQRDGKSGAIHLDSAEASTASWFAEAFGDPNLPMIIARAVLPALGVLSILWALRGVGYTLGFSILAAVWAYADPGVLSYRPLLYWYGPTDGLPLNRVFDPLLGISLFFIGWGAFARAFFGASQARKMWIHAGMGGVALGLLVYQQAPYWTHLAAILICATALSRASRAWGTLSVALGSAVLVSAPYWFSGRTFEAVSSRAIPTELSAWSVSANFAFWLLLVFSVAIFIQLRQPSAKYMLATLVTGAAGILVHDVRWNYTLAPILFAASLWSVRELIQWNRLISGYHWTLRAATLCLLLLALDSGFRATFAFYYQLPR